MKINFTKKEIISLLISALVLGIVFGFDDGPDVFVLRLWFTDYMLMSCLGLIALTVMVLGHKWAAARYSSKAEYNIWGITRFGFKQSQYLRKNFLLKRIPLGIILPLIVAIFTEGKIWFAAVGMMITSAMHEHRIGRKWIHVPDYEEARIAFAGPIATMIFMIVLGLIFENVGLEIWKKLIMVNTALLISSMVPFPQLSGGRMLFTSLYFFVFTLTLAVMIGLLVLFVPTIPALISALILAVLATAIVYFKREV